ncbi:uncharacterized protein LOC110725461 isoform X1 [Chenopodium quinoa]|uniref:uncharacterized protein LOC110725461 isoform X1 n=1 Tax=Chenopodium quinoa TaxID=63459 RepID=UPI000B779676|nr:uncharacterized protein LOC110725461 isoform X1 [Chenopodium quinoa]
MAAFDPANPVFPRGCYLVPTTDEMCFWEPNFDGKQEIDFNKYTYYVETESKLLLRLKDEVLRDIFRSPESPWEDKLKGMVMVSPKGRNKTKSRWPVQLASLFVLLHQSRQKQLW